MMLSFGILSIAAQGKSPAVIRDIVVDFSSQPGMLLAASKK